MTGGKFFTCLAFAAFLSVATTNPARGQTKSPSAASNAALASASASGSAFVPDEKLVARYDEASRLMQTNKPVLACPMLEDIVTGAPQYSAAKQALADCYELSGKLLSAARLYEGIEKEAAETHQEVLQKVAADKRRALAPRMSHLRIVVPQSLQKAKALVIVQDGEKLAREQWGEALPADRGAHAIEAFIMGESVWKKVADVWQEGATLEVVVDVHLPFLEPKQFGGERRRADSPNVGRAVGITIGAFGAAGLGMGAVFGGLMLSKKNESESGPCDSNGKNCTTEGIDLRRDSMAYGNAATGLFIGGAVVAAAGIVVFAVSPSKKGPSATVGIGPQSVTVRGQF